MKTLSRLIVCLLLLVGATFGVFFWLPTSIQYHITEHYTMDPIGQAERTIYLGLLVPRNGPYQKITNLEISWGGEQNIERRSCVDFVELRGYLSGGSSVEAIVEYDVRISSGIVLWQDLVESCNIEPQDKIESDHPLLIQQSKELANGNIILDAYRMYSFTADYLHWANDEGDCPDAQGALDAYLTRQGKCGEYASLMTALCRASGIPSRVISGVMLPDILWIGDHQTLTDIHPGEAHAWVELHTPLGWTIADPAWGSNSWKIMQFGRNDGRHLYFGGSELEGKVFHEVSLRAMRHGEITHYHFDALKFLVAVDGSPVTVTPQITVTKTWDWRWFFTVIVLIVITIYLYQSNRKFLKN